MENIKDIIKIENVIEKFIIEDASFITGAMHGEARRGHPEGKIIYHIREVLDNIDKYYLNDIDRVDLRIIALVHDTFKYKVDRNKPKTGMNHHGMIARKFLENKFNIDDGIMTVTEHHDDAYNAWSKGNRHNDWKGAENKANKLINFLYEDNCLDLFNKFYLCDNETGNKSNEDYLWFITITGLFELKNNIISL